MAVNLQKFLPGYYLLRINSDFKKGESLKALKLPLKILDVTVRGKKMIFILENDTYIVASFGMTGHFTWTESTNKKVWFELSANGKDVSGELYYEDVRKLGSFSLYKSKESLKNSFINTVGPDFLEDVLPRPDFINSKITFEKWLAVVKKVKKSVCDFLLDQKYFSGIGNIYRSEIAYYSKINPKRSMSSLSGEELKTLYSNCVFIMTKAFKERGSLNYPNPQGEKGIYEPVVYGKDYDSLGNKVLQDKCGTQRTIHYVASIQK